MSSENYLLSLLSKSSNENYASNTFVYQRSCPFVKYYKDRLSVNKLNLWLRSFFKTTEALTTGLSFEPKILISWE